jgi:hypothetical protein
MGDGGSVAALFGRCGLGNPLVADFRADPQGHWCCSTDPGAYLLSKPDWALESFRFILRHIQRL